jgi:hypothetical protein
MSGRYFVEPLEHLAVKLMDQWFCKALSSPNAYLLIPTGIELIELLPSAVPADPASCHRVTNNWVTIWVTAFCEGR